MVKVADCSELAILSHFFSPGGEQAVVPFFSIPCQQHLALSHLLYLLLAVLT